MSGKYFPGDCQVEVLQGVRSSAEHTLNSLKGLTRDPEHSGSAETEI